LFFLKRHCDGQQDVGKACSVPRLKKYISLSDVKQNRLERYGLEGTMPLHGGKLRCYLNKKDYLAIHLIDYTKQVRKKHIVNDDKNAITF